MHTRNCIFLFFRLLNLRGGDRPHRPPPPPGYATEHKLYNLFTKQDLNVVSAFINEITKVGGKLCGPTDAR